LSVIFACRVVRRAAEKPKEAALLGLLEMDQETPLAGIRFLIIEDEIMQALLLGEMLSDMGGIIVDTVYGYEQARNAVHENVFDCAVLDINLSGTLSFSIAEMLKNRGIPFVFCTAFADGVDAYPDALRTSWVDKPVQSEELREAVLAALKAGKLAAEGR
jgi:DNA-binding NtrC family response regulator